MKNGMGNVFPARRRGGLSGDGDELDRSLLRRFMGLGVDARGEGVVPAGDGRGPVLLAVGEASGHPRGPFPPLSSSGVVLSRTPCSSQVPHVVPPCQSRAALHAARAVRRCPRLAAGGLGRGWETLDAIGARDYPPH